MTLKILISYNVAVLCLQLTVDGSSRSGRLLSLSPLRTVHETFTSHGSSTFKIDNFVNLPDYLLKIIFTVHITMAYRISSYWGHILMTKTHLRFPIEKLYCNFLVIKHLLEVCPLSGEVHTSIWTITAQHLLSPTSFTHIILCCLYREPTPFFWRTIWAYQVPLS